MRAFETLSLRGQLGRLRRLAETALAAYGIQAARLVPLAHMENTVFRVEPPGGDRFILRIHRATGDPFHPPRSVAEVRSETVWLSALRRETGLAVPEPEPTTDGSPLTIAEAEGVPESRICVLFRWGSGRFYYAGLTPSHLERVGAFIGRLHAHAATFVPPAGFTRRQIGDVSGDIAAYVTGLVAEQCGAEAASLIDLVLGMVEQARRDLGSGPEAFGLIHGDLHQENYLFHRGQLRAIDFDDCGWGHFAYDLAVPLSELRWQPGYDARREGLLRGYRAVRPFPTDHERYVEIFHGLRLLQLTLWNLERREQPGFGDWEREVGSGLGDMRTLVDRFGATG